MVKKRTIYTASDGKEFDNEKEAEEHDKKVIFRGESSPVSVQSVMNGYIRMQMPQKDLQISRQVF